MSAICGVCYLAGRAADEATLRAMAQQAPGTTNDHIAVWSDGPVGLAQRTRRPGAPGSVFHDRDRNVRLVADARIDNARDLRSTLHAAGATPEALLAATYSAWGADCGAQVLGDFAFALWDATNQHLLAVRDPLGVRPFYYAVTPDGLLFGSSISQLLEAGVPARINELSVAAYLAAEPPLLDQTFYEGIAQLPPSHALLFRTDGTLRTWRYWDVDFAHRIEYADEHAYEAHFLDLFEEAVRARLPEDAPAGILLSGGLDSGSVASMSGAIRERSDRREPPFHAFSFAFDTHPEADERAVSDAIAARFGIPTHYVYTSEVWPLKDYPRHGPHRDSPLIGPYQPLFDHALAQAEREGVRTMLGGHRGDLIAGEYIHDFPALFWSGRWSRLATELNAHRSLHGGSLARALQWAFAAPIRRTLWPTGRAERARLWLRRRRRGAWTHPWMRAEWVERIGLEEALADALCPLPIRGLSYARRQRYEAVYMPLHVDVPLWLARTYAPYGIEHADPWSDRRLLEFAVAVPQRVLNRPDEPKRLTRRAMRGIMPEAARRTAGKYSPEPLLDHALKEREHTVVDSLLTDMRAAERGYLDESALRATYEAFRNGTSAAPLLWYPLSLEMWLRTYWP